MIIAIDGPAGTGKGTVSKLISERLGFTYVDTGAMYRAFALKALRYNVNIDDLDQIKKLLDETSIELNEKQKVFLDGEDVTNSIRTPDVSAFASKISAIRIVREQLVDMQRNMANGNNIVMEGRDITTVVFPNADLKIYLTADENERASRRYKELTKKGEDISYEEVLKKIKERDYNDMHKEVGALKIADDAIIIDSTNLTIEEVYAEIIKHI